MHNSKADWPDGAPTEVWECLALYCLINTWRLDKKYINSYLQEQMWHFQQHK